MKSFSRYFGSKLTVLPHQGLGDLILCIGLFRQLSKSSDKLTILVRPLYEKELAAALADLSNISIKRLPDLKGKIWARRFELVAGYFLGLLSAILERGRFLALGYLGKDFFGDSYQLRFDESFYRQAGVEFGHRWESFKSPRDLTKEKELFLKLNPDSLPYAFVHEDVQRGYTIDKSHIRGDLLQIEPLSLDLGYSIFDYQHILERATEIHVIESSFCALVESLNLTMSKFAHRYARPEAKSDWKHEFTYRSYWQILLQK